VLEFRILGPLEVLPDGEPIALPRKKRRSLLVLLLLLRAPARSFPPTS
jgi:DNA-binding SARP family transcriptional activator